MISTAIILIYLSFLLDFVIWPIDSEASTQSLTKSASSLIKLGLWLVFGISLLGYLIPSAIAIINFDNTSFNSVNLFSVSGIIIAVLGRVVTSLGALALKAGLSNLKTSSIFSLSRNPISLGMHVTFLGLIIACSEWWLFIAFVFYVVNIDLKITHEERALAEKFGKPYIEYKSTTPRYLLV